MARAHAGQFDLALGRFRELMQGLGQNDQEEFAASFSENLAAAAVAAGEVATARQVYSTLLARFGESPNLRQKIQAELKRLDKVGKPAPAFAAEDLKGSPVRLADLSRQVRPGRFLGDLVLRPASAELPRLAGRLSRLSRRRLRDHRRQPR